MRPLLLATLVVLCPSRTVAQQPAPSRVIIDMHLHAYDAWVPDARDSAWIPLDLPMPDRDDVLMAASLDSLRHFGIVLASVSGDPEHVDRWLAADQDGRLLPALQVNDPAQAPAVEELRARHAAGRLKVLGELGLQYYGVTPSDDVVEPYFALAEELDIPVAIHMGPGPRGGAIACCASYRSRAGDPLTLEELLARHPGLRLYVMHAGWPLGDEMLAVLYTYPQVYVDVGVINWYIPRPEFHAYLRRLVDAGFGDRIMFGSDQMQWPGAIRRAIEGVESATFLTEGQRQDIFCRNASRFLRLDPDPCTPRPGEPAPPHGR